MSTLSPAALLDVWERADCAAPSERALILASAADPARASEDVAALPLGRRDERLLRLHTTFAGPRIDAVANCPACRDPVEFSVDDEQLLARARGATGPRPVVVDGFTAIWRSPDSCDVADAARAVDAHDAEAVLFSRCVLEVRGPTGEVALADAPDAVCTAIADAMAAADPLAELLVDLVCPVCGIPFTVDLDVSEFVWTELRASAERLLREVDVLARAYGWTEHDILSLSDARRRAYLSLAQGTP